MKKRNMFAKDLMTNKYRKRVIKPKKEKVAITEKKLRKSSSNFLNNLR